MPMTARALLRRLRRFCLARQGAQIVEFTILLPMLLLLFAVIVEGGRLMWSYQATNAGVRDAARYLARVVPSDICTTGGSVSGWTDELTDIVKESATGHAIFPGGVTITAVTPGLTCVTGSYRVPIVAIAEVTASLTVTFPFEGLFRLAGGSRPTIETVVTDRSRVFGT